LGEVSKMIKNGPSMDWLVHRKVGGMKDIWRRSAQRRPDTGVLSDLEEKEVSTRKRPKNERKEKRPASGSGSLSPSGEGKG